MLDRKASLPGDSRNREVKLECELGVQEELQMRALSIGDSELPVASEPS